MLTAVIIDDELRARRVLKNLIHGFCEGLSVLDECANVQDAVSSINKHKPDLVFCDIEMPEESGFELFKYFEEIPFEVIFTTGYSQYALKAFEVSAVDYLLKPIEIDQLVNAVEKVRKLKLGSAAQRLETLKENLTGKEIQQIVLPTTEGTYFIQVADVLFFEADGAYTRIHLENGVQRLASKKLKYFDELLHDHTLFFRIHRSYLINVSAINYLDNAENKLHLRNRLQLSVARDRKANFIKYLEKYSNDH